MIIQSEIQSVLSQTTFLDHMLIFDDQNGTYTKTLFQFYFILKQYNWHSLATEYPNLLQYITDLYVHRPTAKVLTNKIIISKNVFKKFKRANNKNENCSFNLETKNAHF